MLKFALPAAMAYLFCLGLSAVNAQFVAAETPSASSSFDEGPIYRETAVYGAVNSTQSYPSTAIYAPPSEQTSTDVDFDIFAESRVRLAQNTHTISPPKDSVLAPVGGPAPDEQSMLQGITMQAEWVPQLEETSLAQSNVNLAVKLGMPAPLIGGPLLVTPSYGLQMLDGPNVTDVPARMHEFQISFATFRKISPKWMVSAVVNLGIYGDDYSLDTDDAFRVSGMLMGIYTQSSTVKWVFGVAALNRDDIPVLPIVGVTIDQQWVRYELTFPRPRIAWKLPGCSPGEERIVYVGGDLGGGAWAVQRTSGMTDTLNLSRYGLLIGYERSTSKRNKISYELGYLFNREIEYERSGETFDLDDSLFARVNLSF